MHIASFQFECNYWVTYCNCVILVVPEADDYLADGVSPGGEVGGVIGLANVEHAVDDGLHEACID